MSAATARVTPIKAGAQTASVCRYLSPAQVCEKLPGFTEEQLKQMRAAGKGPAYIKPGGPRGHVTLYLESDIDAYLAERRVSTREQR